jgi:hypothetical protein
MQPSVKAALLSGLVFPGIGQFHLRRPLRGLVFFLPSVAAGAYFGHAVMEPMLVIAREILAGTLPFDPFLIQARVDQTRIDTGAMNLAALVLVVTWIASTVDAWWLGRAQMTGPDVKTG